MKMTIIAGLSLAAFVQAAHAEDFATKKDAESMVAKAVSAIKSKAQVANDMDRLTS